MTQQTSTTTNTHRSSGDTRQRSSVVPHTEQWQTHTHTHIDLLNASPRGIAGSAAPRDVVAGWKATRRCLGVLEINTVAGDASAASLVCVLGNASDVRRDFAPTKGDNSMAQCTVKEGAISAQQATVWRSSIARSHTNRRSTNQPCRPCPTVAVAPALACFTHHPTCYQAISRQTLNGLSLQVVRT
jgi:hypothetical protein